MTLLIGFLTFLMVLISLFLILLVLVQLPKKEAGVGMAFGAGMSEMLLGAGSGNVLTRITKYSVGIFLGLALVLSILISSQARKQNLGVTRALEEQARSTATPAATTPPTGTSSLQPLTGSNALTTPAIATTTTVVTPTPPAATTTTPIVVPAPETTTPAPTPAPAPATPPGN